MVATVLEFDAWRGVLTRAFRSGFRRARDRMNRRGIAEFAAISRLS